MRRGQRISPEKYREVPEGWHVEELIETYARLGGRLSIRIDGFRESIPQACSQAWKDWLCYRNMLYRISDGVKAGDPACIELAVRYIELQYIGSYAGYLRARFSRNLKHAVLTVEQKMRLHWHFSDLLWRRKNTFEHKAYLGLWRCIITPVQLTRLVAKIRLRDGDELADYLFEKMRPGNPQRPGGISLTWD